jgi:hypothetical protein
VKRQHDLSAGAGGERGAPAAAAAEAAAAEAAAEEADWEPAMTAAAAAAAAAAALRCIARCRDRRTYRKEAALVARGAPRQPESLFGVHEFSDFCVRSETVRNRLFGVNEKRSE